MSLVIVDASAAAKWFFRYDCLYLALAVHLNAEVVTADRRFMNSMSGSSWRDYLLHVSSIPE